MFYGRGLASWTMRSCQKYLSLGLVALALATPSAFAKEIHIATIDSAPFGFRGADGKPTGMIYEISNLIAEEAGFTYTNEILPYARTVHAVGSGDADFVIRYGNAELENVAIQVARVLSLPTIVVGHPSVKFESLKDLHGKTVGIPRGGRFDDAFEADTAILKYPVADYAQSIKMLTAQRIDAGIGSSVGLYYNAHLLGIKKEQLGKPLVLSTQHFALHFSKKRENQETIVALRNAVARLEKRNEIKIIVNKYLSTFDWDLASK